MATVNGAVGGVKRDRIFKIIQETTSTDIGWITKLIRREFPDLSIVQIRAVYNQYHCFKQLGII